MKTRESSTRNPLPTFSILTPLLCLLVLICIATGCQPKEPPNPEVGTPTQANTDGYNYQKDADRSTDFIYNQLWYFNFIDESQDIAGVAAYGLANPDNLLLQQGQTNSFGMIIRDASTGGSFPVYSEQWDAAVPGNFSASDTFEPGPGFEFENLGGTIDVIEIPSGVHQYNVVGEAIAPDGSREMHWELEYTRGPGPAWRPWVDWPVPHTLDIFPAWISYHMNMPNAVVNGTFRVVDRTVSPVSDITYTLTDAKGYHDGFYSKFVFSIFEWDWLDYKQYEVPGVSEEISVHLLHPHAPEYSCRGGWETCTPGNLRVYYDGKEYNFYRGKTEADKQVFITYDELAVDPLYPGVQYPTEETITAEDDVGNRLDLHWSLIRYMIVYFDVPDPFFDTVTFEIIADFSGTFYESSSGTTVPISGSGWADWSGPAFPEG